MAAWQWGAGPEATPLFDALILQAAWLRRFVD